MSRLRNERSGRGFMGSLSKLKESATASKSYNFYLASLFQRGLIKTRTRYNLTIQLHDNIRRCDTEFSQQISNSVPCLHYTSLTIGNNSNGIGMIHIIH